MSAATSFDSYVDSLLYRCTAVIKRIQYILCSSVTVVHRSGDDCTFEPNLGNAYQIEGSVQYSCVDGILHIL